MHRLATLVYTSKGSGLTVCTLHSVVLQQQLSKSKQLHVSPFIHLCASDHCCLDSQHEVWTTGTCVLDKVGEAATALAIGATKH